jgi:hypothetical protein
MTPQSTGIAGIEHEVQAFTSRCEKKKAGGEFA